ncbi:hypothetical protein C8A03DRAFT_33171 [Achaetomium macrosporum]|uniref:NAD(P)-binding domain-containing protein n=1 Tax=Achaetomium macrosporum TaxID=79813 RepID=A0AAN7HEG3_9PEZI|nr:hypothetical protein C8A03DRAFT_33171 [Achaetomium macrosporum]
MQVVGVAGGTASIGRAIVDAIVEQGVFELIVLSRKASKDLGESLGARVVAVDSSDLDSLTAVLENNKVHTVVSALGNSSAEAEGVLIQAAEKSSATKRFIPSVGAPNMTQSKLVIPV